MNCSFTSWQDSETQQSSEDAGIIKYYLPDVPSLLVITHSEAVVTFPSLWMWGWVFTHLCFVKSTMWIRFRNPPLKKRMCIEHSCSCLQLCNCLQECSVHVLSHDWVASSLSGAGTRVPPWKNVFLHFFHVLLPQSESRSNAS